MQHRVEVMSRNRTGPRTEPSATPYHSQINGAVLSHLSEPHKEQLIVGQVDGRKSLLVSVLLDPGPIRLKTTTAV